MIYFSWFLVMTSVWISWLGFTLARRRCLRGFRIIQRVCKKVTSRVSIIPFWGRMNFRRQLIWSILTNDSQNVILMFCLLWLFPFCLPSFSFYWEALSSFRKDVNNGTLFLPISLCKKALQSHLGPTDSTIIQRHLILKLGILMNERQ